MIDHDDVDFAMLEASEDFWAEIEQEAAKYEVTVDYYLMEFYS